MLIQIQVVKLISLIFCFLGFHWSAGCHSNHLSQSQNSCYHTEHLLAGFISDPNGQLKASAKSGELDSVPRTLEKRKTTKTNQT